ncbi:glycine betaine ABC transporter substrate-binding protein [Streptomyces sp. 4F14]|uniref:glycine betaine ABC transporter substrate-binding protein n=1 Tax=Streptomyces sp. 4F14 TaxID=3394380 RepID=UPI003A8BE6FE
MTATPLRAAALAVCSLAALTACTVGGNDTSGSASDHADCVRPIVIGADTSAESQVVAALYGELLSSAGEGVRMSATRYASAPDTVHAVVEGDLDLAPAYESTTLGALPRAQTVPGDMDTTLSMALPPGIDALPPAAAQRGVVLTVTRDDAGRHGLRTVADLAKMPGRVTLGGAAATAPDAPSAVRLRQTYGVTLTPDGASDTADVQILHSTDPRGGRVVLGDPRGVVPPEHVFPLISAPCARPDGRAVLARLGSALTTGRLSELAASVAAGRTPSQAARAWLHAEGLRP